MTRMSYLGEDRWLGDRTIEHGTIYEVTIGKPSRGYLKAHLEGFEKPLRYKNREELEKEWISV